MPQAPRYPPKGTVRPNPPPAPPAKRGATVRVEVVTAPEKPRRSVEDFVEHYWGWLLDEIDSKSVDAGLSRQDAADIYSGIAEECRTRARQLEDEEAADGNEAE